MLHKKVDALPFRAALVEAREVKLNHDRFIWEHRLRYQRTQLERREAVLKDAEKRFYAIQNARSSSSPSEPSTQDVATLDEAAIRAEILAEVKIEAEAKLRAEYEKLEARKKIFYEKERRIEFESTRLDQCNQTATLIMQGGKENKQSRSKATKVRATSSNGTIDSLPVRQPPSIRDSNMAVPAKEAKKRVASNSVISAQQVEGPHQKRVRAYISATTERSDIPRYEANIPVGSIVGVSFAANEGTDGCVNYTRSLGKKNHGSHTGGTRIKGKSGENRDPPSKGSTVDSFSQFRAAAVPIS